MAPPQPGVRVPKFSLEGKPNSVTKRVNQKGETTHYIEYDADGLATKRVDLTGAQHGPVPTPHVLEYFKSCGRGGKIYVNKASRVRPAKPEEIP